MTALRPQVVLRTARRALSSGGSSSSGNACNGARSLSVAAWRRWPQTEAQQQQQQQQQQKKQQQRRAISTAAAAASPPSKATQTRNYASASASASSLPGSLVHVLAMAASLPPSASASASASSAPLVAHPSPTLHPALYATVLIHGRPYLVTPGDRLKLPFRMPDVRPGDELRLDRVGVVGTRNVTAVGAAAAADAAADAHAHAHAASAIATTAAKTKLSGQTPETRVAVPGASVTAVVLGVETEPLRILIKKKRRCRRKRSVRSKHQYTVLRIQDVVVEEV